MKMFFVAGIGLAVFIEFLLMSKKQKSTADRILTVWMFLVVAHLFLAYLYVTEEIFNYPFLLGIEQPFPLFHGVFLYLYVCFLTNQLPERRRFLFLHFIPASILYLWLIPFFILSGEEKAHIYRTHGAGFEMLNMFRAYANQLTGIVYVTWSALLIRKHRKAIRDQFSDLEKVNLQWLQVLTFGLGGIWVLVIAFNSDVLILSGMVLFVFLIGFFGVRQADIFSPKQMKTEPESEQKKKYPKSGLTEEASAKLHEELKELMAVDALYKKSDLSISDLSSRLGVHSNYLSQIINQKEKKNFYDFVNTYRVDEFKRLIAMPRNRHLTLLSIAYDCGFNSKSSFNRYFKKATGQTPSEYFSSITESRDTTP